MPHVIKHALKVYSAVSRRYLISTKMSSLFTSVEKYSEDLIFSINRAYNEDDYNKKVNLSIGAYRDNQGKPYVLPIVKKVEIELANNVSLDKEYLPISGLARMVNNSIKLIIGDQFKDKISSTIHGVQSLSGTGALKICIDFLNSLEKFESFAIPDLTWPIHRSMLLNSKVKNISTYRYLDISSLNLDFDSMISDIKSLPDKSVVLLQCCCHNPTGVDPSINQWKILSSLIKKKNIITIFDAAYIGFSSGSFDEDCSPIRIFLEENLEIFVCVSFAKCFGLYNERIGLLFWSLHDSVSSQNVLSNINYIIRNVYSNPPSHGARIVDLILNDDKFKNEWLEALEVMNNRIKYMRKLLFDKLNDIETPGSWNHLINQRGMFSYTGLKENHVARLASIHHIYLLKSGRINICGLNEDNVNYVASCIKEVLNYCKNSI